MKHLTLLIYLALGAICAAAPLNVGGRSATSGTADTALSLSGTDGTVITIDNILRVGGPANFDSGKITTDGTSGVMVARGVDLAGNRPENIVNMRTVITDDQVSLADGSLVFNPDGTITSNGIQISLTPPTQFFVDQGVDVGFVTPATLIGAAKWGNYLLKAGGTASNTTVDGMTLVSGTVSGNYVRTGTITGGVYSNITVNGFSVSGTMTGNLVRSGTTAGGVWLSPTITTPVGLAATDIPGTAATLAGNNSFTGTNNTALNQVGVTPSAGTMLVKAQADALYPPIVKTVTVAETCTNTTIPQNSTQLSAYLDVGIYRVRALLIVGSSDWASAGTVPGIVFTGSASAGPAMRLTGDFASATPLNLTLYANMVPAGWLGSVAQPAKGAWVDATWTLTVTAPGNLRATFCQFSATSGTCSLIVGSRLEISKQQ